MLVPARPTVASLVPARATPHGHVWVKIHGEGFAARDTVRFGTRAALRVREVSPRLLLALCPPGAGRVTVTVHTAAGTSVDVRGATFRY